MCWLKYNSSLSKSLKRLKFYIASEYIKYNTVSNSIIEASNDVTSTIKSDTSGWFNYSKHILQLLVEKRSAVLDDFRQLVFYTATAKEMTKEARNICPKAYL